MVYVTASEVLTITGLPSDYSAISQSDINRHIVWAESKAQKILRVSFTPSTSSGVTVSDEEYDGDGTSVLRLRNRPVNAVTALSITYNYGDSYTSITPSKVWVKDAGGLVILKPTAEATTFPSGTNTVKISYRHGIVPDDSIKEIILLLAGMQALAQQAGGTFDDVTSYQLPEYSVSKGEPYTQIRETFFRLREQYDRAISAYPPWPVVV